MFRKTLILFLFLVCLSSFVTADISGLNNPNAPKVVIGEIHSFGDLLSRDNIWTGINIFYNASVFNIINASQFWITNEGDLDNVVDIQTSWLTNDAGFITASEVPVIDLTGYATLNGSNQPFTGDVSVPNLNIQESGQITYNGTLMVSFE